MYIKQWQPNKKFTVNSMRVSPHYFCFFVHPLSHLPLSLIRYSYILDDSPKVSVSAWPNQKLGDSFFVSASFRQNAHTNSKKLLLSCWSVGKKKNNHQNLSISFRDTFGKWLNRVEKKSILMLIFIPSFSLLNNKYYRVFEHRVGYGGHQGDEWITFAQIYNILVDTDQIN